MQIPKNLSQLIKPKGLLPNTPYVGVVVDNNCPSKAYRIRVRVPGIHDHLDDEDLPWSAPTHAQPQGIIGGEGVGRTQSVSVPEVESTVALYFNQNGDPMQPTYSTNVPIAKNQISPEFQKNYPNRLGYVLPSGYTFIHDKKTKETFLEAPGDANLTILGDVNLNVVGNIQARAVGSTGDLPSYVANAPERVIGNLQPDPQKKISFNGLYGGDSGNIHLEATNSITMKAGKNFKVEAGQQIEEKAGSSFKQTAGSSMSMKASSTVRVKGSAIYLN